MRIPREPVTVKGTNLHNPLFIIEREGAEENEPKPGNFGVFYLDYYSTSWKGLEIKIIL